MSGMRKINRVRLLVSASLLGLMVASTAISSVGAEMGKESNLSSPRVEDHYREVGYSASDVEPREDSISESTAKKRGERFPIASKIAYKKGQDQLNKLKDYQIAEDTIFKYAKKYPLAKLDPNVAKDATWYKVSPIIKEKVIGPLPIIDGAPALGDTPTIMAYPDGRHYIFPISPVLVCMVDNKENPGEKYYGLVSAYKGNKYKELDEKKGYVIWAMVGQFKEAERLEFPNVINEMIDKHNTKGNENLLKKIKEALKDEITDEIIDGDIFIYNPLYGMTLINNNVESIGRQNMIAKEDLPIYKKIIYNIGDRACKDKTLTKMEIILPEPLMEDVKGLIANETLAALSKGGTPFTGKIMPIYENRFTIVVPNGWSMASSSEKDYTLTNGTDLWEIGLFPLEGKVGPMIPVIVDTSRFYEIAKSYKKNLENEKGHPAKIDGMYAYIHEDNFGYFMYGDIYSETKKAMMKGVVYITVTVDNELVISRVFYKKGTLEEAVQIANSLTEKDADLKRAKIFKETLTKMIKEAIKKAKEKEELDKKTGSGAEDSSNVKNKENVPLLDDLNTVEQRRIL